MSKSPHKPQNIRMHIKLAHIEPPIWRRILVPADITLAQLHEAIQSVMGWTRSHLHEFRIDETKYGIPDEISWDSSDRVRPEGDVFLHDVLNHAEQTFTYVYDFGDDWHHELVVEEILETESDQRGAYCLGGERNCPPEDVGGPFFYPEFLRAIADPSHEDHEHFSEWVGDDFDPEAFDAVSVNEGLEFMAAYWQNSKNRGSTIH